MKKTKAVLAILMAGIMMLGLAGCGGNAGDNGSRNGGYTGKNKSAGL